MSTMTEISKEKAFKRGSVLVFEGYKMTGDQVRGLNDQFQEAIERDRWPLVVSSPGPVYFASERDKKSHEFAEFVASLDTAEAAEAISVITVRSLVDMAKEALQ